MLDTIQYEALRVVMGLMRSTPTNVILGESGECDLESRRLWLAAKFYSKIISLNTHPLIPIIRDICHLTRNCNPQNKLKTPYITQTLPVLDDLITEGQRNSRVSCFRYEYKINLIKPKINLIKPKIINLNLNKDDQYSAIKLNSVLTEKFPNWTQYYTDGSKIPTGVGMGVHSPEPLYN